MSLARYEEVRQFVSDGFVFGDFDYYFAVGVRVFKVGVFGLRRSFWGEE